MTDREKLIELIAKFRCASLTSEEIADHLIANNVVIQKQGEWVYDGDLYSNCSVCGASILIEDIMPDTADDNYCTNCGAKMKEVK